MVKASPTRIFLSLIAALTIFRLLLLGRAELYRDEAFYWMYAQYPDLCYATNPPMIGWIIWLTTRFGQSEFWIRLGPSLLGSAVMVVLFLYARRTTDAVVALAATVLLLLAPLFWLSGLMATVDIPLVLCWIAATWCLDEALARSNGLAWLGVGIALGLGVLSKFIIILFAPVILIPLFHPTARHWWKRKEPYVGFLLLLFLALPVLIWNLRHDFASVTMRVEQHVGESAGELYSGSFSHFLLTQLLVWSPALLLLGVWTAARDSWLGWSTGETHRLVRGISATAPILFFVLLAAAGSSVHPYWTAVAVPPAMLSISVWLAESAATWSVRRRALLLGGILVPPLGTAILVALLFSFGADRFPLPFAVRKVAKERLLATPDEKAALGRRVRDELLLLPADALITSSSGYAVLSEIAYYSGEPKRAHLLQPKGLGRQFTSWRSDDLLGRDAVFVVPGRIGSFPLALFFESGSYGKPFVASDSRGISKQCEIFIGRNLLRFESPAFRPVAPARREMLARRLYRAVLDREADPGGLESAVEALSKGELTHLTWVMAHSPEFRAGHSADPPDEQISRAYRSLLDREPQPQERLAARSLIDWSGISGLILRLILSGYPDDLFVEAGTLR